MTAEIAVVDYGLANIRSVLNALHCFTPNVRVAERGEELDGAAGVVLPGVGSFDAGVRGLRERGHEEALNRVVREKGVRSWEFASGCSSFSPAAKRDSNQAWPGSPETVRRFPEAGADGRRLKVPHIGWNAVRFDEKASYFADLEDGVDFYFNHSFYVPAPEPRDGLAVHLCEYGDPFAAALELDDLVLAQFHPEKSQLAGMKLLETFVRRVTGGGE